MPGFFPCSFLSSSTKCWLGVFSKTSASYNHRKLGLLTGSDVSHVMEVTGRGPVRKYVLRMHNRKLCNIHPSGAFWLEVTSVLAVGGFPRVRAYATGSCAISALVGILTGREVSFTRRKKRGKITSLPVTSFPVMSLPVAHLSQIMMFYRSSNQSSTDQTPNMPPPPPPQY